MKRGGAMGKIFGFLVLLFLLPGTAFSQDEERLPSAFSAYVDLRLSSIEKSLGIIASTLEAESGKTCFRTGWDRCSRLTTRHPISP